MLEVALRMLMQRPVSDLQPFCLYHYIGTVPGRLSTSAHWPEEYISPPGAAHGDRVQVGDTTNCQKVG